MKNENNSSNYVAFFLATVVVLLGYDAFFGSKQNNPSVPKAATTVINTTAKKAPKAIEIEEANNEPEKQVDICSQNLLGSLSTKGARISNMTLKKYKTEAGKEIVLLDKDYYVTTSWSSNDSTIKLPTERSIWHIEGNTKLSPGNPVTLTWDNKNGLIFKTIYSLDTNYLLTVEQKVSNTSDSKVKLQSHIKCYRSLKLDDKGNNWSFYNGPIGVFDNKLEEVGYDKISEKGDIKFESKGGWSGITDKYWLVAIIPDSQSNIVSSFSKAAKDCYVIDTALDEVSISANSEYLCKNNIFIGAKEISLLDLYEQQLNVKNLDLAIDFGYLYIITKPMLYALSYLQGIIGNMGICILLLTVLLKLLLFPLANKSYKSMNRLREFQPRIKALQDRYKDDRVRLGQEISALYKREKINPLGGCLPALLQSPILFALYKVLYISIDMRQAPFFGWIHDLSMPDSCYILNLFGLIPVELPSFLQIGIWPILMGLSMLIQQKMTPQVGDQAQAKMMMIVMPLMFVFMFASLPSGLVIYWTWSNLLGIVQQYIIMRK